MAKSIALAPDASRLASLLLSYIPAVCAFVAPRPPGASPAIIDRLSHSRALRAAPKRHLNIVPAPVALRVESAGPEMGLMVANADPARPSLRRRISKVPES